MGKKLYNGMNSGDSKSNNPGDDKDTENGNQIEDDHFDINDIDASIEMARTNLAKIGGKAADFSKKLWGKFNKIPKKDILTSAAFFIGLLIYLEFVLHIIIYRNLDVKIIYPILFAVPLGALLAVLTGFFNKIVNMILTWLITGLTCLLFGVQLIYVYIFKVYFSFQSLGMAGDALSEFSSDIIIAVKANIWGLLFIFLPLFVLALLQNQLYMGKRRELREQGLLFAAAVLMQLFTLASLFLYGRGDYSPYDLYHNSHVNDMCGKELGIITMTRLDIGRLFTKDDNLELADTQTIQPDVAKAAAIPTKKPSQAASAISATESTQPNALPAPTLPPTPTPIDTSPNIMNFDFNALAAKEKNETIRTLHQYFANVTPTNKNEYTGMFKGYNLILLTAEGFSPYAVNKDKTPTLYRLTNEGFVFKNFYTPLWQTSTSDGEYVALTGLIPVGSRSMYRSRNDYLPLTLAHLFDQLGIKSKAYHNHTYTYYQRNETHPNLGYDYKGVGNGLVLPHDTWPNSDLEMINATVDEYINEDQFHVYYMTVSGHMNYTFVGNSMSYKNKALVDDLPYSSDAKAYIACQIELDKALEQLIKKLEEAGVADHTVIALSADHYPYGWDKKNIDEIAGHTVDPNFEIYRNYFILWSEGMKEDIVIDKPCSSLDILPTLSNLFGFTYDSRLLMGQDILSDAQSLVILNNRSFITDKVMYNSATGEATKLMDEVLPDDYISNLNKIVKNKFNVSQSIIENDYYRHLYKN